MAPHWELIPVVLLGIVRRKYYINFRFLFTNTYRTDIVLSFLIVFVFGATPHPSQWAGTYSFTRFLDHTQRRTTVGRTHLDKWSARPRDLYPTTHNTTDELHASSGIRTRDLSSRVAVELLLRPRGHWDRVCIVIRADKRTIIIEYT